MYYDWLSDALKQEFESLKLLKESDRGTVTLIRHRASGKNLFCALLREMGRFTSGF